MIPYFNAERFYFPPLETALHEPDGLLVAGGDLSPTRLLQAYQQGIFPWYSEGDPILWWSPYTRAAFWPEQIHTSRSLRKFLRKNLYSYTINYAFSDVIKSCAEVHSAVTGTWITPDMMQAYQALHQQGHAHSIEVWSQGALVGGLYGVLVGQVFCGESMFHRADHASKCALLALKSHFQPHGLQLIDCQVPNPHLMRLGAVVLPRHEYLHALAKYGHKNVSQQALAPQKVQLDT
ncbi:leucyl/phenylalanyl-tRNA--protein transferase [Aliidiomarina taiwanensis]|uniref:Leucyl/phenylalanyl-tRNA--protein transferase n=1 Tax=Aliidiomarina taiwanensis TaxID=946228 RepID=A0A432X9M4_9GAMM|nr:leucyl/phenylalanyl-tRNA--protein transferase [Aliidiomarina taiwanensis]RUO44087.1 leucyl/phenylalanyl-tRNA--protein transferase [Aliidiomarina taiwanensis]